MSKIQSKLKKVLKETPIEKIEDKLNECKGDIDALGMLQAAHNLTEEKKKKIYDYVAINYSLYCGYVSSKLNYDEDRKLLISLLLEKNKKALAYDVMRFMDDPTTLDEKTITIILSCKNSLMIYECFGELFIDAILKRGQEKGFLLQRSI